MKTVSLKGGSLRSWQREVGYGVPPEWYSEDLNFELDQKDPDLTEVFKNAGILDKSRD